MRLSPVHAQLAALQPQWEGRLGMRTAARIGGDDAAKLDAVAMADVSFLQKFGLKGPNAQQWLANVNISPPANANNWAPLPDPGTLLPGGSPSILPGVPLPASFPMMAVKRTTPWMRACLASCG